MLSENLKKFRKIAGFRQDDIAKVIGLDRSAYAYYESGKTEPNVENLLKIAKMLGVDVNTLIGYEPPESALEMCNDQQGAYGANETLQDLTVGKCSAEERLIIAYYRASSDKKAIMERISQIYNSELSE